MLLFSFCFVCVCVYWRSPQHTHACRLVAWHMRIKFWASTCACVCVLLFFFFSSLFSMVRAKWRRCSSCCVSYLASVAEIRIADTHTHTHLRMSIFCQKMCSCYSHTHTHSLGARIKCERRNFWLSEHLSLPAAFSYISLCLCHSNYLLLLRQCLRRVCNIASPFAQAAF